MQTINLQKLIEERDLDRDVLAAELFPGHKFPNLALARVIQGKSVLDANQISRLAQITGLNISDLFEGATWKSEPLKKGLVTFTSGRYRAELDTQTLITKIYHIDTLFHTATMSHATITISDYLRSLDEIIFKHVNS